MAEGILDLHSHLVPGVDDGAETVEAAVAALAALGADGVVRAVTTPHLDAHVTRDPELLEARLGEVDQALARLRAALERNAAGIPELLRGHEVALDDPEPCFDDPRTRLAGTDVVLVEWPVMKVPSGDVSVRMLTRIREAGWIPVLAHPERYRGLGERPGLLEGWRRAGALLQVNHGSLLGVYGRQARSNAVKILRHGLADLLSSDYHGWRDRPPGIAEVREWFADLDRRDLFEMLTRENPRRLLEGAPLRPPPPLDAVEGTPGLLTRLKDRLLGT